MTIPQPKPILTPNTITHPALCWALTQGKTSTTPDGYTRISYHGLLHPQTNASIADYLRRWGALEILPRYVALHNHHMELSHLYIEAMGGRVSISLTILDHSKAPCRQSPPRPSQESEVRA